VELLGGKLAPCDFSALRFPGFQQSLIHLSNSLIPVGKERIVAVDGVRGIIDKTGSTVLTRNLSYVTEANKEEIV